MNTMITKQRARPFAPLDHLDDIEAFRHEIRAWLAEVVPPDWQDQMRGASDEQFVKFQQWWLSELQAVGLATCHWPKEWGGANIPLRFQAAAFEEYARAQAPNPELYVVSLNHLPGTLFAHGTKAQQERYLGGIRNGHEVWCQGFSEPNAGSDLASLRTAAVRDGDEFVINGQKIWSSYGMYADFCLLLARTDPTAARKHDGISYFIMDMHSPGITVRPIRQITGQAEFSEVFLDNVRIPAANLIGTLNQGWNIAQSTLSAERGLLIYEMTERAAGAIGRELTAARADKTSWMSDDQHRREFTRLNAQLRAVRLLIRRMLSEIERGDETQAGVTATYIKLNWAQTLQALTEFQQRVAGLDGQIQRSPMAGGGHITENHLQDFLASYSWTIAGGSNEIMRNVIAERLLKLPR